MNPGLLDDHHAALQGIWWLVESGVTDIKGPALAEPAYRAAHHHALACAICRPEARSRFCLEVCLGN